MNTRGIKGNYKWGHRKVQGKNKQYGLCTCEKMFKNKLNRQN